MQASSHYSLPGPAAAEQGAPIHPRVPDPIAVWRLSSSSTHTHPHELDPAGPLWRVSSSSTHMHPHAPDPARVVWRVSSASVGAAAGTAPAAAAAPTMLSPAPAAAAAPPAGSATANTRLRLRDFSLLEALGARAGDPEGLRGSAPLARHWGSRAGAAAARASASLGGGISHACGRSGHQDGPAHRCAYRPRAPAHRGEDRSRSGPFAAPAPPARQPRPASPARPTRQPRPASKTASKALHPRAPRQPRKISSCLLSGRK